MPLFCVVPRVYALLYIHIENVVESAVGVDEFWWRLKRTSSGATPFVYYDFVMLCGEKFPIKFIFVFFSGNILTPSALRRISLPAAARSALKMLVAVPVCLLATRWTGVC